MTEVVAFELNHLKMFKSEMVSEKPVIWFDWYLMVPRPINCRYGSRPSCGAMGHGLYSFVGFGVKMDQVRKCLGLS